MIDWLARGEERAEQDGGDAPRPSPVPPTTSSSG
jgi:hypothetical protein